MWRCGPRPSVTPVPVIKATHGPVSPAHTLLATALQSGGTASACTPSLFPSRHLSPRAPRVLFLRKGAVMGDAKPSRVPLRDDLRVVGQEIAAMGSDPLRPSILEEIAGVTLLHATGIVNTVRVPLVVLDATLHVLMANRYFYECFQVTPQETEAHRLYDLGNGQWNIPAPRPGGRDPLPNPGGESVAGWAPPGRPRPAVRGGVPARA